MATVTKWTPFGVALNITATSSTVTRISATQYTVKINVSWETHYSGAQTNYGMIASSGGASVTINPFGKKASSGSGTLTGTYSISGNQASSKTVVVTFNNFNNDNGHSAKREVSLTVSVPAWTSYTVKYNANGGSGAPGNQTKWKDQRLTLSSTKPTRTGYTFLGWSNSSTATTATYSPGADYTANASLNLYAVWKAHTYTVTYSANGGSGAPPNQTKTYGVDLTISSIIPTRTDYAFKGWGVSSTSTTVTYQSGSKYTNNANVVLYAIWDSTYKKPAISSLQVFRCDANGDPIDLDTVEMTYMRIKFDWTTSAPVSDVYVSWVSSEGGGGGTSYNYSTTPGEYSGSFDKVINNGTLSVDTAFEVSIEVCDTTDSTTKTVTLESSIFTIDLLNGGKGIAFGKAAELENVADIGFMTRFSGGILYVVLKPETDLNDVLTPGLYIGENVTTYNYENCPVTSGTFTMEIASGGEEGQIRQRIQTCHKTSSVVYERYYYQSEFGEWYEAGGYKSAITVGLTEDIILGAVNTYTQVPFDVTVASIRSGFSLIGNYIKVGKGIRTVRVSAQLKINGGTIAGIRHGRICKNTNGTVKYISWINNKFDSSDQTTLVFTPIIANVSEGDLLYMLFYTPDSTDINYAGGPSNGYQTYKTVESI